MSKPTQPRNVSVPADVIAELLTESEMKMVQQRLLIIKKLEQGSTIRQISEEVGVGTDTVVRVAKKLRTSPKLRIALQNPQTPSSPKWIFGKVSSEE